MKKSNVEKIVGRLVAAKHGDIYSKCESVEYIASQSDIVQGYDYKGWRSLRTLTVREINRSKLFRAQYYAMYNRYQDYISKGDIIDFIGDSKGKKIFI